MLITLRPQKVKYLLSDNFALAELKNLFPLNCLMKIHYDFQMRTTSLNNANKLSVNGKIYIFLA